MQGLQQGVCAAAFMALSVTSVWAQTVQPDSYGFNQPIPTNTVVIAERAGERISLYSPAGLSFRLREINAPGASFIKLHFSEFRIPEGVVVEISNPESSEVWQYSAKERDLITVDADMGDDGVNSFSAMSITGPMAASARVKASTTSSTVRSAHHSAITIWWCQFWKARGRSVAWITASTVLARTLTS